ncbi:hypothetical protein GS415_07765 [Rhodococcus hoagii]|nr:hypothetical protein [Prescottella equi]
MLAHNVIGGETHHQRQRTVGGPEHPAGRGHVAGDDARSSRQLRDVVEVEVDQGSDVTVGLVALALEQRVPSKNRGAASTSRSRRCTGTISQPPGVLRRKRALTIRTRVTRPRTRPSSFPRTP